MQPNIHKKFTMLSSSLSSRSMEWLSKITGNDVEERKEELYARYERYNQQHVFDYWNDLSEEQKSELLNQLNDIQVEELYSYLKIAKAEQGGVQSNGFYDLSIKVKGDIKPFLGKVTSTTKDKKYLKKNCHSLGMDAIKANKVATVLLAGGQGTRLGFNGPKGMYDIGMPSKRTLFQMVAERILKLTQLAVIDFGNPAFGETVHIPLYIMTSPMNHEVTKDYFESNKYFGLPEADVTFFTQGTLPCLAPDGKIIMETKSKCAMAPDGNGGIYPAMQKSGVLDDMKSRGIKHIHAFAIDNALVKPADPTFIGYCISEEADCGNKVLWKEEPHEKVGVIAERDGKPCVIEYSELSSEMAEKAKGMGKHKKLVFGAANICNHYYSMSFLRDKVLPNQGNFYHIANKKIPCWDASKNETITPSENNGIKLETFIFDVFPLSTSMAILEVDREEEFAPVKNAPGSSSDSPDTAREKLSVLAKSWLQSVKAALKSDDENGTCEVGPLTSYSGEGLDAYKWKIVDCPFNI